MRFVFGRVTIHQQGHYQHRLSLQQAARVNVSDSLRRMSGPDFHDSNFPPGVLFSSLTITGSHLEARPNLQTLLEIFRPSAFPFFPPALFSWSVSALPGRWIKLMLLTGPANFPGPYFNQASRGLCVCITPQHNTDCQGADRFSHPGPGGDPPGDRFLVRSAEAKEVTDPRSEHPKKIQRGGISLRSHFFPPFDSEIPQWADDFGLYVV